MQSARADLDYADLIGRIDERLTGAAAAYQQGDADTAKDAVQSAYFEIFENLEGPIRVNVSAARSYELEAEFGDIRKLIIDGAPPEVVQARIEAQIAAIRAVLPDLESGVRLRGEPGRYETGEAAPEAAAAPAADEPIEPEWQAVVDGIGETIAQAAAVYEQGEAEQAVDLVLKAQFDGYKNSLLETAIRRYRDSNTDAAINGEFSRIVGLIHDGRPARMVAASGKQMVVELTGLLPGLPLLGDNGTARPAPAPVEADKDWAQVGAQVMAAVDRAIATQAGGDSKAAVSDIQNTYFDVFEASGMEGAIGLRDAGLKADIESHFSHLTALFK
ncbi:MAG: iron permease, partial [Rhodobacterales bacterium]